MEANSCCVLKYAAKIGVDEKFARAWYAQVNDNFQWLHPKTAKPLKIWKRYLQLYWKCRDEFDPLPEATTTKQEAKPRVFTEKDWILCEERCMNYDPIHHCCRVQFAVPPEMRDRPIPPQECRGFLSLPEGIRK